MLPSFVSWFEDDCLVTIFITGHRFLKATATSAAPTQTSWLSRADMQRAAVLSLTGKREINGTPSLKRKAQGQAPKWYIQGDPTGVDVSLALWPQEMQCFVLHPCWFWDAASGTGCNLLEEATHENMHILVGNGCFWSLVLSSCCLNILTGQSVLTLGLWKMDVKAPAKF